jgi:hypothetical protein
LPKNTTSLVEYKGFGYLLEKREAKVCDVGGTDGLRLLPKIVTTLSDKYFSGIDEKEGKLSIRGL